ncbi:ComF family protein [Microbispora sp. NPDC049125]|uniref:ComF family protein n=1 Tax=Microbispora sp. NPDC049125 TaxID=3154929 RepID=UPI0034659F7F
MGDSAHEVTERYINLYRNVPAARPGVCRICHSGPNDSSYVVCDGCRDTMKNVRRPTSHVVPVSLCVKKDDQLYDIVSRSGTQSLRRRGPDRTALLAATISRFYAAHALCLKRVAGGDFTMVTTVPSTRSGEPLPAFHPMPKAIQMIAALKDLYRPVLWPDVGAAVVAPRESNEYAFKAMGRIDGEVVLLVDDIFVTGAHVQSAASALHRAGAASVTALVVARLINPEYNRANSAIWTQASAEPFSFDRCCLCSTP